MLLLYFAGGEEMQRARGPTMGRHYLLSSFIADYGLTASQTRSALTRPQETPERPRGMTLCPRRSGHCRSSCCPPLACGACQCVAISTDARLHFLSRSCGGVDIPQQAEVTKNSGLSSLIPRKTNFNDPRNSPGVNELSCPTPDQALSPITFLDSTDIRMRDKTL